MPEDQSARGKELCYVQPLRIAEENDGAYHVVPDVSLRLKEDSFLFEAVHFGLDCFSHAFILI